MRLWGDDRAELSDKERRPKREGDGQLSTLRGGQAGSEKENGAPHDQGKEKGKELTNNKNIDKMKESIHKNRIKCSCGRFLAEEENGRIYVICKGCHRRIEVKVKGH